MDSFYRDGAALAARSPLRDRRVGEIERSRTCDELAAQFAAGRITDAELDERLEAAVSARTHRDLDRLVADLPTTDLPGHQDPGLPRAAGTRRATSSSGGVLAANFTVLDAVVALIAVGCALAVAALMMMLVMSGQPALAEMAVVGGSAAAVFGASTVHLMHRAAGWGNRDLHRH